jgi:hypothetical protein
MSLNNPGYGFLLLNTCMMISDDVYSKTLYTSINGVVMRARSRVS